MDLASKKSWFAAQPEPFKILVLLGVMHELTMVLRGISTTDDKDLMWKSAWIISECNHRLVSYAFEVMTQLPHYPDEVIIEILFDHIGHPALEPYADGVWDRAVEAATKFGAHLQR
jgi:hypothetical protein